MLKLAQIIKVETVDDKIVYTSEVKDPKYGQLLYKKEVLSLAKYTDLVEKDMVGQTIKLTSEWKPFYNEYQIRRMNESRAENWFWAKLITVMVVLACVIFYGISYIRGVGTIASIQEITVPLGPEANKSFGIKENYIKDIIIDYKGDKYRYHLAKFKFEEELGTRRIIYNNKYDSYKVGDEISTFNTERIK